MDELLVKELESIKVGLETKTVAEVKNQLEAFETKLATSNSLEIKAVKDEMEVKLQAVQAHADKLDIKLQEKGTGSVAAGYFENMTKSLKDNFEQIKGVRKGAAFQTKAVGDMTLALSLTGDQPRDYNFDVVMKPGQMLNVADLVGSVDIDGGTYTFPREGTSEGSITTQVEGASKSQIDYDVAMIDVNTDFIAGFTRYSKKMANNLPFLTSFIPKALRRDYFKAENSIFNAVLAAAATASTEIITGQNKVEMLIAEIAKQEDLDFPVNAIVVRPSDYWDILITEKSAGAGYGLPGVVTFEGGVLRINGVPIYKATWLTANKYFVGDWSRITKVNTQGLSLEFSEQEGTNFVKNNITARIESQTALAVEQPAALVYGDFTATAPSL